jgi:hypothetical protein
MSARDTIVPLLAGPWQARAGARLSGTPLPGLSAEGSELLTPFYPGGLNADIRRLLRHASDLAETPLGDIDFTGRWFPEEPLPVFRPCLSLAVDGKGRRWIAEGASEKGLPAPVWCVLVHPPVVMYVSDDLHGFLAKLHEADAHTDASRWLQDLSEAAFAIWDRRHGIARLSRLSRLEDRAIRSWLYELPPSALVYDLRVRSHASGWPYRLGEAEGYLYRCGRLALFAVAD